MTSFSFLSYQFKNESLLESALTHKSFAYEGIKDSSVPKPHNEKLEFLGDAVLDLILSEYLMECFPTCEEGELSKMRAHLVNESGLARQAEKLKLAQVLMLGKGETQSGGAQKPRLLSSAFEALVGALFLEAGFDVAKKMVREIFEDDIESILTSPDFDQDYKSQLQELVQGFSKKTPIYELKSQLGPAHDRIFEVQVMMGDQVLAVGQGKTKKAAEQNAAALGLNSFKQSKGSGI